MTSRADIAAYDKEGRLTLVVEVKNKLGTNSEWAAGMYRNIVVHRLLPRAPFFLLALPDRFYLWKDKPFPGIVKPTFEIDPSPFLKPYFEKAGVRPAGLSGPGFELLITAWLNDLLRSDELPETLGRDHDWLIASGLFDAIRNGNIVLETTL